MLPRGLAFARCRFALLALTLLAGDGLRRLAGRTLGRRWLLRVTIAFRRLRLRFVFARFGFARSSLTFALPRLPLTWF